MALNAVTTKDLEDDSVLITLDAPLTAETVSLMMYPSAIIRLIT